MEKSYALTMPQVAEELQISRSQAYNLRKHGLPVIRIGKSVRVLRTDLEAWLEERKAENALPYWVAWDYADIQHPEREEV